MKENKIFYIIVLVSIIIVAIIYFPLKNEIEGFADNHINMEASGSRDSLIEKKDSLLQSLIKSPISGKFTCVLFHNNEPQYKEISSNQRDHLIKADVIKGIDCDNILYTFNPTFITEEKYSLNSLCYDIIDWNTSKGHDKYVPLKNKNLNGWFQSGWALGCASGLGDSYECFLVHPYIIDFGNKESNISHLKEVLDYSFFFFTQNENSDFYNCNDTVYLKSYVKLNTPSLKGNDYWYWETEGALDRVVTDEFHAWQLYGQLWKYKDYKVYLGISNRTIYHLKYDYDFADKKKEELITSYRFILLFIVCIIELILILLLIYNIRAYNYKKTSYLQRIVSFSNPQKFMKKRKYDKEKLGIANSIHDVALKANENDEMTIISLSKEIEKNLGLYIISKSEIKTLKKKCDPKNFMKPYNSVKIAKANELFVKLNTEKLPFGDYVSYMKQVSELYDKDEVK